MHGALLQTSETLQLPQTILPDIACCSKCRWVSKLQFVCEASVQHCQPDLTWLQQVEVAVYADQLGCASPPQKRNTATPSLATVAAPVMTGRTSYASLDFDFNPRPATLTPLSAEFATPQRHFTALRRCPRPPVIPCHLWTSQACLTALKAWLSLAPPPSLVGQTSSLQLGALSVSRAGSSGHYTPTLVRWTLTWPQSRCQSATRTCPRVASARLLRQCVRPLKGRTPAPTHVSR